MGSDAQLATCRVDQSDLVVWFVIMTVSRFLNAWLERGGGVVVRLSDLGSYKSRIRCPGDAKK